MVAAASHAKRPQIADPGHHQQAHGRKDPLEAICLPETAKRAVSSPSYTALRCQEEMGRRRLEGSGAEGPEGMEDVGCRGGAGGGGRGAEGLKVWL